KSHPYIEDMAMFLSPLPVVLEWHCVMCEQFCHGEKYCEACGTGIYCRAVCTKSVYSYQPDVFQHCGGVSTESEISALRRAFRGIATCILSGVSHLLRS